MVEEKQLKMVVVVLAVFVVVGGNRTEGLGSQALSYICPTPIFELFSTFPREELYFIAGFHCHAIENKNQNRSLDKRLTEIHVCAIFHIREIRRNVFTELCTDGDAMLVPH